MTNSTRPPRVAVLMSTYNGEAFLAPQLDSLAAQERVVVEVFVRDDGSTDRTLAVLARYAGRWQSLANLSSGPNLGPARSFLELLRTVPGKFDYYAFCDQDDVWLPNKLSRAIEQIVSVEAGRPALYCSNWMCVDENLNPLGMTQLRGTGTFDQVVFANIAGGNTMVMNAKAAALIRAKTPGSAMIMHDWWCILVVAAIGVVVCDTQPCILYRQHQQNTLGSSPGRLAGLILQFKQFLRDPKGFYPIRAQVAELLRLYGGQMGARERELAEALVDSRRTVLSRIRYAVFGKIVRFDLLGSFGTRVLILAGLY